MNRKIFEFSHSLLRGNDDLRHAMQPLLLPQTGFPPRLWLLERWFENLFQTFSRSPFPTRLYRFHPWNRTAYIHVGVQTRFYLLHPCSRASLSVSVRKLVPDVFYRPHPCRRPDSTLPIPSMESYRLHPCSRTR